MRAFLGGLAVLVGLAVAFAVAASSNSAAAGAAPNCANGRAPRTTLIVDGTLYAVVRGQRSYLFGWSGRTVNSLPEALRLIRALGFEGTDRELFQRLQRTIPGGDYSDGGDSGYFFLTCRGVYRATALVRRDGPGITGTRFWLQQGELGQRVTRAFCMPEQWVPAGALVSVTFRAPLSASPPVFTIDWDGNGRIDSVGPFRAGGARFPNSLRC